MKCQCEKRIGECCPECHGRTRKIGSVEVGAVWFEQAQKAMEEMERATESAKVLDRIASALEGLQESLDRIASAVCPSEWPGFR